MIIEEWDTKLTIQYIHLRTNPPANYIREQKVKALYDTKEITPLLCQGQIQGVIKSTMCAIKYSVFTTVQYTTKKGTRTKVKV